MTRLLASVSRSPFVAFSPQAQPLKYTWTFSRADPPAQLEGSSQSIGGVIWVPRPSDAGTWTARVKLQGKDQQDHGAASVEQRVEPGDDDIDELTRVDPNEKRIVPIGSGALFQRLYYQLLAELEAARAWSRGSCRAPIRSASGWARRRSRSPSAP